MNLDIDKDWFAKKAAEEGDLEIGAGGRKTLTVNLTPDEVAVLERLVNPEAAELRNRNAALSRNLDHWRHEVGKLNSRIDRVEAEQEQHRKVIRFALGWVRHWQEDVAGDLKPTPESLAMVEAKLKEALDAKP